MVAAEKAEQLQAEGRDAEAASPGMRVLHGGRVDTRLLAAFESLAQGSCIPAGAQTGGGADRTAARLVSTRCWETLSEMATTLEEDLGVLASGACSNGNLELFRFRRSLHLIAHLSTTN
jgi:hypothetical protein